MTTPAPAATATRAVGRSFVAAPAPKCKSCAKSVYPMEKIEYDGQVFHQECFKCLKCKTRVVLVNVAMIKGDLYCKNCFKKVFGEKGKYDSFGEKTQAKWTADHKKSVDVGRPSAAGAPTTAAPASTTPSLAPVPEKRSGSNAAPVKKEEPKPEVKKEEPKPVEKPVEPVVEKPADPAPVEEKQPEPVAEPAPVEQAAAPVEATPEPSAAPVDTPAETPAPAEAAPAEAAAPVEAAAPAEAPAEVPADAAPAEAAPTEVSA